MRKLDELHLRYPFRGSRRLRDDLWDAHGLQVNRKRVQRLMRLISIRAQKQHGLILSTRFIPTYCGQEIYRNLTNFFSQTLPPETSPSNVTHIDNHKIQRAHAASGRMHLADTVVLRRVLQS